ncbi:MAG TPA: redoxin domain-containing protein [Planctomycetaceae bacterium]|nr:redoxin domain-containing protein [Planctomycetaceae bacterium]
MRGTRQIRHLSAVFLGLMVAQGCGQLAIPPGAAPRAAVEEEPEGCRITGRIVSTAWQKQGGRIERAIVDASTVPGSKRVEYVYGDAGNFKLHLKPGKYRLSCSANGSRGATFDSVDRDITIQNAQDRLDLGDIDLPISKTTALYGKPAPELTGIIAWQDTPPVVLESLRGKVVVLDFFAYTCSICHEHKPDLVKLREKYKDQGLVVLAIHDASLKTLEELNAKMDPLLANVFRGSVPELPMALDGAGEKNVCDAYGIYAVPAVILIDKRGQVVRRYHHAGVPELESDVRTLLSARSNPVR